ncbi:MAG: ABC transporter substrate-binding protein [Desulfovibrio sp.]|jgi:NitT/TauT family transport system substrate-binding protein|nr:ABC transporter substrate-binding protein [Desulfovibrio sp.]
MTDKIRFMLNSCDNKGFSALAKAFVVMACLLFTAFDGSAQTPVQVRTAYLQNDLHHLALWVGMYKDFYKAEGIEINIVGVFRSGPEVLVAFGSGGLDAAFVGEAPVTLAVARGTAKVQALAQANTEGSAIVVSNHWKQAGKRERIMAIPGNGSVQDMLLRKASALPELAHETIKPIVLSPPDMLTALQAGEIDGFVAWEPYPSRAQALNIGRVLYASADIWRGHPCCVFAVSNAFAKANPGVAQAMLRAHQRSTQFIIEHPDEAVPIAVKFTGMDESVVRKAMGNVTYTPELSVGGEEEYVRFLGAIGYINPVDPAELTRRILGVGASTQGGTTK